eukprot:8284424-Pyramimonas_sp.AAC.1
MTAGGNSHGYGPCETSKTTLQCCSLLGGRHIDCGHVDPSTYLSNEFAEKVLDRPGPSGGRLFLCRLRHACVPQHTR